MNSSIFEPGMSTRLQYFFALFLLTLTTVLNAQHFELKILGKGTGDPVPLANVVLLNTGKGTVSDFNGRFSIDSYDQTDTLVVMSVSFLPFKKAVSELKSNTIIYLEPEKVVLEDVKIKVKKKKRRNRKTDPAYLLHKAIVEHKKQNDFQGNSSYSCDIYNRIEVDANNVTDNTRNLLIFRPISFLFDDIDSTSLPKKFVPILFSEGASRYHHDKDGSRKEIVMGSKISGIDIPSLSRYTGNMYLGYNVYDDYLNLFQKDFVSPVADAAWWTYNYYLTDSLKRGDTTLYKLEFVPRRKNDLAFLGELWTDNKTYAVRSITMQLLPTANVNYINHFEIDLNYELQKGEWVLKKENLFMDIYLSNKTYGFYLKKSSDYLNHDTPKEFEKGFFKLAEKSIISDSLQETSDQYIAALRPEIVDSAGEAVYVKIDSVMSTSYVKFLKRLALMTYTGYFPLKYFEIGPYYTLYSFNPIEGNRFKFTGATMTELFPNTQFLGHVAYGTTDQKFKGQARMTHFYNLKKWRYFRLDYFSDYAILSSSENAFVADNIMSSLSRRVSPRFTHVTKYSGEWYHAWYPGIENYVRGSWEEYRPVGSLNYLRPDSSEIGVIRMNTVKVGGRIAFDERFVSYGFRRFSLSTRKPIFDYSYTHGFKINGEGYDFSKLELSLSDRFYMGFLGFFNVVATAGKVWGDLPYPMLLNHPGNDSYYYDKFAFNLMNPFEFVSDEQVSLMLSHHFNGMIMNQIPLLKKLHFRSFVFGRGVIGRLSSGHEDLVLLPEGLSALNDPYLEAGFGFENILKLIRVDFLWRLSNIGPDTQKFGMNFAVQPRL